MLADQWSVAQLMPRYPRVIGGVRQGRANRHALDRLLDAGCRYCSTLIGVARLAYSEFLVELEATAVA